ncbi:MAG: hypothetical protein ACYDCK_11190 [Thermoplasmatota archaeon]
MSTDLVQTIAIASAAIGALVTIALVAGVIVYIGKLAYDARLAREAAARRADADRARPLGTDPLAELERTNAAIAAELTSSRATLEATRETLKRGLRG